jgi:hypothetical protein
MAAAPTIYLVSDMRTVPDSATGGYACITNTTQHQTRNGAEERYHTALATAARSTQYQLMSAVMFTNDGFVLASQSYEHDVQPEQPAE